MFAFEEITEGKVPCISAGRCTVGRFDWGGSHGGHDFVGQGWIERQVDFEIESRFFVMLTLRSCHSYRSYDLQLPE